MLLVFEIVLVVQCKALLTQQPTVADGEIGVERSHRHAPLNRLLVLRRHDH
eukprot:m.360313 g.360313  ORF g.360313 m.360313 type:complete len:51 (+) comp18960_c0_seq1:267-419(+)